MWHQKHETEHKQLDHNLLKDNCRSKAYSFGNEELKWLMEEKENTMGY
jgi:hypothetical protein